MSIVVLPFVVGLIMSDGTEPLNDPSYHRERLGEVNLIGLPGQSLFYATNTRALDYASSRDWPLPVVAGALFDDQGTHRSRMVFALEAPKHLWKGDTLNFARGTIDIDGYAVTRWHFELELTP